MKPKTTKIKFNNLQSRAISFEEIPDAEAAKVIGGAASSESLSEGDLILESVMLQSLVMPLINQTIKMIEDESSSSDVAVGLVIQ